MSYTRQRTLGRYGKQLSPPTVTSYTFPASTGGINAVDSLIAMPPQDCIYTYNLMPSEYGMRLRKGYRQWATGCVESPQRADNVDVRTIIPFESKIQDAANDRLFAVTAEGIWDVSLFNDLDPIQEVVFTQTSDPAGYGVWAEFTGDAAGTGLRGHYLFYADGLNGIWQFEEETDTWSQPPSGVDPLDWFYITGTDTINAFPVENVAFVMVFKQRIWVILEDEDDAWYLPTASITGELKKFTFGSKMPHGGNLMGLWNWTVDGGSGVDDLMVAVSRGGDVIVYKGEDPEITPDGSSVGPWSTVGTWFIGAVPNSRRIVTDYGPDLYVLSTFGLESLNNLMQGAPEFGQNISAKVNRFLRNDVENGRDLNAWQVVVHPGDGFLQIITPKPASERYVQYNLNLQTQAWGFWEGVPILGADSWNGEYYMGGEDGVVYINDGTVDGTELANENIFANDNPVAGPEWSIPAADEYYCDGTQVAETKYVTDSTIALVENTIYTMSYKIRALIPPVNSFQDVTTVPPGPEWSVPVALEFNCDGTQVAETTYQTNLTIPMQAGIEYEVDYSIKDSGGGNHAMRSPDGTTPFADGDGIFTSSYSPTAAQTTISLVGDVDFVGTFYDVAVYFYDGAGRHKMQVGTDTDINGYTTGSGTFNRDFTADANYTTISMVGNEQFDGQFYDVSIRVKSGVGQSIEFRTLTNFQAPAGHSNFNRVGIIRAIGIVAGATAITISAVYDYSIEDSVTAPGQVEGSGDDTWDSGIWDSALWDFGVEGQSFSFGALGVGRAFAVSMAGNSSARLNIIGWDCLFNTGGFL